MSIVSSNMISKHYCPKCYSFDLVKLHRTFVEKRILGSPNKFQCRACEEIVKQKRFESNIPKEVPVFIDQTRDRPAAKSPPKKTEEVVVSKETVTATKVSVEEPSKPISTPSSANASRGAAPTAKASVAPNPSTSSASSAISTKASAVHEASVAEELGDVAVAAINQDRKVESVNRSTANQAPPVHSASEELVDEPILSNEKKGVWPYVVGSTVVLVGIAYAFVWMPLTSNAGDIDQMDMSIGSPEKALSEVKLAKSSVLPDIVEVIDDGYPKPAKSNGANQVEMTALVDEESSPDLAMQELNADELPIKAPINKPKLQAALSEVPTVIIEQKPTSVIIAETNLKVVIDKSSGTVAELKPESLQTSINKKADMALGGLASAEKLAASPFDAKLASERMQSNVPSPRDTPMAVPTLETAISSDVATKPMKQTASVIVGDVASKPVNRADSAIKPTVIEKSAIIKADAVNPKSEKIKLVRKHQDNDTTKLLERAAIKLMEHDLDRLLLK